MSAVTLTANELVETLKRSQLPTILVEGRDDMTVYEWLEPLGESTTASVLQCGGRSTLLQVFARRAEFAGKPFAFVADQDMWLFTGVPAAYEDLILTAGYSIENDLLDGSCVRGLLTVEELAEFEDLAGELSRWFAFEVEEHLAGREARVNTHPNAVIPLGTRTVDVGCVSPRTFREPTAGILAAIQSRFHLLFRGKCLLSLYSRILTARGRRPKFGDAQLLEIAAKINATEHTKRLARDLVSALESAS